MIRVEVRNKGGSVLYRCRTRFMSQCELAGRAAAEVVGDEVRIGAPLAAWMPEEDGAMNFKVSAWAVVRIGTTLLSCEVCGDTATDWGLPAGRVQ
ncbi:MAG: hypothetical protein ACT4P6_17135 [Gemmatimonadaceae bacterium]